MGISERQIRYYYSTALKRGYNLEESRLLKDVYFMDDP